LDALRYAEGLSQKLFPAVHDAGLGGLETIADQARDALRRHVLEPLAAHLLDHQYGGFLVDFDERWRDVGPHDKSLEHAARSTMVVALLDKAMPGEGCDQLALHGCEFLQERMWDHEHGGFFALVDRQGRPRWNGLKHPHAVTYTVQAFHLCRGFLGPGVGERWVQNGLHWLNEVAWDAEHGGYWGSYRADNSQYLEGDVLPTVDGLDPLGSSPFCKEINTQSDALEMLAADKAASPLCVSRLEWLTALISDRLVDGDGVMPYAYGRDWRPVPGMARIGHHFQTSWRLLAVASQAEDKAELITAATSLVDFCLACAAHPSGGFYYAVDLDRRRGRTAGPTGDERQWWVEFEALRVLHRLAQHELVAPSARAVYLRACEQQWSFVRAALFDEVHGGVREQPLAGGRASWCRRSRPGGAGRAKATRWKDASHETATLISLAFHGAEEAASAATSAV
jgi:N-acylglucosamine 2-epimerase